MGTEDNRAMQGTPHSWSLTPKHWLKTESVLFSINYYMTSLKKRRLEYLRSIKSSPLSETEFHFQDLLMTQLFWVYSRGN